MPGHKASRKDRPASAAASPGPSGPEAVAENCMNAGRDLLDQARRLLCAGYGMDRDLSAPDLQRYAVSGVLLELYVNEMDGVSTEMNQVMAATDEEPDRAVRTIDRLEEMGIICRDPDRGDRRPVVMRLTAAGRRMVVSLLRDIFEPEQDQLAQTPPPFGPPR